MESWRTMACQHDAERNLRSRSAKAHRRRHVAGLGTGAGAFLAFGITLLAPVPAANADELDLIGNGTSGVGGEPLADATGGTGGWLYGDGGSGGADVAAQAAAAEPASWFPTLTPQTPNSFLDLVQAGDGYAFTTNSAGDFVNNDLIGTIAMQVYANLASGPLLDSVNTISGQILAGDWASADPVTTTFFEDMLTNYNLSAFSFLETTATQADGLLADTVYATDLNDIAAILWP